MHGKLTHPKHSKLADLGFALAALFVALVIIAGLSVLMTWVIGAGLEAYCVFTPATKLVICKS